MYYNAQRKLAFVLPPRTGTTTFSQLLREWGVTRGGYMHPKPSEMQLENANQYKFYGFFRDPLDRFLSIIRYVREGKTFPLMFYQDTGISINEFVQMNYDQMLDAFPKYQPLISKFFDPQKDWLANATLLDFNNYHLEILRVARMFDVTKVNVSVNNWTEKTNEVPSQRVIDFVQSYYADDYLLGHEKGLLT